MTAPAYIPLRQHTEFSITDGTLRIKELVKKAAAFGLPALGISDLMNTFGLVKFYKACRGAGIKPVVGADVWVVNPDNPEQPFRAMLLVRNEAGYRRLCELLTRAYVGTDRNVAHAELEPQWLAEGGNEGLICLSGAHLGEVGRQLMNGHDSAARAAAQKYAQWFPDAFYLELQRLPEKPEWETSVSGSLKLAAELGLPVVATHPAQFLNPDDFKAHDARVCIAGGWVLADKRRPRDFAAGQYFASPEEVAARFADLPEALQNTVEIAKRCNLTLTLGKNFLPQFPTPDGMSLDDYLAHLSNQGLRERLAVLYPDEAEREQKLPEYQARLDFELGTIVQMGFPGYFLIVADFINWAKNNGCPVGPGRGSGAGSLVAYSLKITDLDPLRYALLFERFLNPERVSMPDIDVDFDERRRGEVIEYVEKKYGAEKVSQVVTFGTIKTKQALKDSARVLGYPFEMGERMTKALPPTVQGKDIALADIHNEKAERFVEAGDFRQLVAGDQDASKVFELAQGLAGLTRQWGVHACAVLMCSEPLMDVIPIMKRPSDGATITQFEYPLCEELGVLKMDFLGLSNLTTIEDALDNIVYNGKERVAIEEIELDDQPTFELLQRADTLGVFQLDGSGMRALLKQMRPTEFEDISAVSALYRPGPMGMNSHTNYALRKNGLQEIAPIHPELEEPLREILAPTYGLIVYQEQVMQIARVCAGFTMGQADTLRKAMGKKKLDVLQKQFEGFSAGMLANGYSKECVDRLWEILVPFAQYAFNKSHSACYGVISYWTAFLKANYPVEFMAALLTSKKDNKDKLALYLGECRRMGITVLVPDVNDSDSDFSAVGEQVRFGLSAVRNVGANVVEGILGARREKGAFTSFQDFLDKVPLQVCNKRAIECLVKAGAFDSMGYSRKALLAKVEEAVDSVVSLKKNEAAGQFDLFGGADVDLGAGVDVVVPDIPEWDKKVKLDHERDMLGLYVSDHPLSGMEHVLDRAADTTIVRLMNEESIQEGFVSLAGLITSVQPRVSKKNGKLWATIILEDLTGSAEINFFPATYQTVSTMLTPDTVAVVKVRVQDRDGTVQLSAQEMTLPSGDLLPDSPVELQMPERMCTAEQMASLARVLSSYPGSAPVRMHIHRPHATSVVQVDRKYYVQPGAGLFSDLRVLLGRNCLR